MKRTHPALWGFGWAGLFVGSLLAVLGMLDGGETARMAVGYGLLMAGSAVYLLGGLGVRRALAHRAMLARARVPAMSPQPPRAATTTPATQA
jgi:hypothetical protein